MYRIVFNELPYIIKSNIYNVTCNEDSNCFIGYTTLYEKVKVKLLQIFISKRISILGHVKDYF